MFGLYEVQILLQLYESIFLSKLLFNCQSWTSLRKSSDIPSLESMQYKYLKQTMHIPYSTPNAGLLLELGILPIKDVVNIRKLTFLHHILSLTLSLPDFFLRTYASHPGFPPTSEFFVKHGGDMKQGTFK